MAEGVFDGLAESGGEIGKIVLLKEALFKFAVTDNE